MYFYLFTCFSLLRYSITILTVLLYVSCKKVKTNYNCEILTIAVIIDIVYNSAANETGST